ncbi:sensor histidine kinase [Microbacterium sp. CFH 90308]|uniref:Sensor histidine kinase n=1 Tax=Microbacterium salsuginis TaxID=2722803 RepID=A0ABX1K8A4_9MICO|nr:sensor histidine kinase [Microbacterium sp. CFH 90308]NLP83246.1 sensor histidine kinase [Microbacterium sp. CFH 90308]
MVPARRARWTTQRKLAWASIACADVPAIIVLLESTLTDFAGPTLPWVWWSAFVLFILTLMLVHGILPRSNRVPVNALLVALIALAVTLVAFYPEQGWNALLFVVTAAAISFFWDLRTVIVVAAAQTATVGAMFASAGWPLADVLMGIFAYANFQAFGVLIVFALRSEAHARSELAVTNAELRSTAALLEMTSREAERLRIARDLHDLAGHHLTALSLELEVLMHLVREGAEREHVEKARRIARDLLASVGVAVSEMREAPNSIEPALRSLTDQIAALDVSILVHENEPIRDEHAVIVIRCVQEAITNSMRHSDATRLDVVVDAEARGIRVSIVDDGSGSADVVRGNGLNGMAERFEGVGGTLEVGSPAGGGFRIVGTIPLIVQPPAARQSADASP